MKTSELTGAALDYAVFIACGYSYWTYSGAKWDHHAGYTDWVLSPEGVLEKHYFDGSRSRSGYWEVCETWAPSTDWAQGGPIIQSELICIDAGDGSYAPLRKWAAWLAWDAPLRSEEEAWGTTPLIAAMRCFVKVKLGDEVQIPWEVK